MLVKKPQNLEYAGVSSSINESNALDLTTFKDKLKIDIVSKERDTAVVDIKGIDAPIANALRRILLTEIETMAIDKVVIYQNTSVMQDEILAHRIGLLPVMADPEKFDKK